MRRAWENFNAWENNLIKVDIDNRVLLSLDREYKVYRVSLQDLSNCKSKIKKISK